jgi:hypothetical protein
MLYGAEVAVCSEINTKHINADFLLLNLLVHHKDYLACGVTSNDMTYIAHA